MQYERGLEPEDAVGLARMAPTLRWTERGSSTRVRAISSLDMPLREQPPHSLLLRTDKVGADRHDGKSVKPC